MVHVERAVSVAPRRGCLRNSLAALFVVFAVLLTGLTLALSSPLTAFGSNGQVNAARPHLEGIITLGTLFLVLLVIGVWLHILRTRARRASKSIRVDS